MGEASGFRLGRYDDAQLHVAGVPSDKAPWVWIATREDAAVAPVGIALALLFRTFSPPRFGFIFFEQDLLQLAADPHTNQFVAQHNNLASKHKEVLSYHLRQGRQSDRRCTDFCFLRRPTGVRGVETRRHLLKYLGEHPEELHPQAAGTAGDRIRP